MTTPGVTQPVDRSVNAQMIEDVDAGHLVADIQHHWRGALAAQRFDDMCATMQDLLNVLEQQANEERG